MTYDVFDVDVPGGRVHYGRWGSGENVVLAIHGITANHRSMRSLADQLGDDYTVIAPDLRGRGGSVDVTGPFGMARHADDCIAILDHAGLSEAVVLGHSMGGFVSVVLAQRAPERVRSLVLVDGGLPLDLGPLAELPVEELTKAIIGPALERLEMTFESPEAYLDYWRPHPALADAWSEYVEDHYTYDLGGTAPDLRSRVNRDAVLGDSTSQLVENDVADAVAGLAHRTVLVRAERGLFNQVPPLYPDTAIAPYIEQLPTLREVLLANTNHYTILLKSDHAAAVAGIVRGEFA